MFHIDAMKVSDFPFAVALANTMDWNLGQRDFELNMALEPNGCFVLFDDSSRIGVATCISFGRIGWFGNLIVKEGYRNQGCGELLVGKAIGYLKERGVETVGLYTYQHLIGYYEKIGFKPSSDFSVIQGRPVPHEILDKAETMDGKRFSSLIEFDGRCLQWDRRRLLEAIVGRENTLCYISSRNNQIVGYIMARLHEDMVEIGPLVCLKDTQDSAAQLVKTVLSHLAGWKVFMCLPTKNSDLVEILCETGLKEEYRLTRMFLGPAVAESCTYIAESIERG